MLFLQFSGENKGNTAQSLYTKMRSQFFRQIAQKFRISLCWCDFPVKPKKHAISTDRVQILGAVNQIRTGDLFLTKEVLYQLSYNSISFIVLPYCSPAAFGESTYIIIAQIFQSVNEFFLFWKKECFCRLKFVLFDDSDQFRWNSTCCICKEKR